MTRLLVLTLLILLVTEIGPPIYRASVPEGLAVVEAHDKPKPDPPKPGPGRDPNGLARDTRSDQRTDEKEEEKP